MNKPDRFYIMGRLISNNLAIFVDGYYNDFLAVLTEAIDLHNLPQKINNKYKSFWVMKSKHYDWLEDEDHSGWVSVPVWKDGQFLDRETESDDIH